MQQQTGFVPANTTFKVTAEYSLCSNKIERYVDKETDEFLSWPTHTTKNINKKKWLFT